MIKTKIIRGLGIEGKVSLSTAATEHFLQSASILINAVCKCCGPLEQMSTAQNVLFTLVKIIGNTIGGSVLYQLASPDFCVDASLHALVSLP